MRILTTSLLIIWNSAFKAKTLTCNKSTFSWGNTDIFLRSRHFKTTTKPSTLVWAAVPREFSDCLDEVWSGCLECKSQPRLISGGRRVWMCSWGQFSHNQCFFFCGSAINPDGENTLTQTGSAQVDTQRHECTVEIKDIVVCVCTPPRLLPFLHISPGENNLAVPSGPRIS